MAEIARLTHPSGETMHPLSSSRKLVCERSGTVINGTLIHSRRQKISAFRQGHGPSQENRKRFPLAAALLELKPRRLCGGLTIDFPYQVFRIANHFSGPFIGGLNFYNRNMILSF
ncbi:hypothetical protein HDG40_007654 [Paraburkholderia sp. JPY158]|uniref:Uncharacterized protein n=1 Tax=Paraburkholderia atlantica TaxID=2654982 RepID=A0A7W8QFB3_PARAM|nr:hypothetical protein [Paraburkholderia atlantica]MBB5429457.1 hypothetical protein [Paraburkholderia atlantica]